MVHEKLYEAARANNVATLHEMLQNDRQMLFSVSIEPSDNPLHVAALFGHRDFAKAVMDQNPRLAIERNDKGYYPIHLASSKGHLGIVEDLLDVDLYREQCLQTDLEGRTPLQLAAIKGQMEVIRVLLTQCPWSAKAVTLKKETVLHLVVKYNLCEVMELLLSILRDFGLLDEIVNYKDEDGNTVLHLAAAGKRGQMLKILAKSTNVDVNAVNDNGLTALETSVLGNTNVDVNAVNDNGFTALETSVLGFSEINDNPKSTKTKTTSKNKSSIEMKDYISGILILNSLLATISFDALLNVPDKLPERGQGIEETVRSRNLTDAEKLLARLCYVPYQLMSVVPRIFNVTVPVVQGSVDASTYIRSDPYHFLCFLDFGYSCFFCSLITIIVALAFSFGGVSEIGGLLILTGTVSSVISAVFLYISVFALITNTSTAFAIVPVLASMFALSLAFFIFRAARHSRPAIVKRLVKKLMKRLKESNQ